MRRHHWLAFVCLGAFGVLLADSGQAQDTKAAPLDSKAIDTMTFTTLRDVINRGADLYNSGDWAGCYRLYEGALMAIRPLLAHRATLQEDIQKGLRAAEAEPVLYNRAFVLRRVIDKIRTDINPNPKKEPKGDMKAGAPKEPKKANAGGTLWERLGGEKDVASIVDDIIKVADKDAKVDFTRRGKWDASSDNVFLRKHLVQFVSSLTGGPFKYEGVDMRETHKGMGITNAQYDAFLDDVDKVLANHNVSRDDIATIRAALDKYREEIVAPAKKPDDKKPDDKSKEKGPDLGAAAALSGKVTYKGEPVKDATIHLHGPDTKGYSGKIKADGSYELKGVKAGEYKVTIDSRDVPIPKRYSDANTTPLKVIVPDKPAVADLNLMD
jgi:hypothetical protein